jgi:KipI family sensor histidine kinase inhibitor
LTIRFDYASDQSLRVSFGPEVSLEVHQRIRRFLASLQRQPVEHVRNLHPAYASVLLTFDPCRTDHPSVEREIRARLPTLEQLPIPAPDLVEVPMCYGGQFGPDLAGVAAACGLDALEVVRRHSNASYIVFFLGFVPGFAYLGGLPASLAVPRLAAPRRQVPAGSLGIAAAQTAIYPIATPGGWQLIGRTPWRLFDPAREPMSVLKLGDRVRFRCIDADEFRAIEGSS